MKRFVGSLILFSLLPAVSVVAWVVFVMWIDGHAYHHGLLAPQGCNTLLCDDSQTRDGVNPEHFPGLFNCSASATTLDQNLLRLSDVLSRNPDRFKCVLLDIGVMQWTYDPSVPLSRLQAQRVHFPVHIRHRGRGPRPLGNIVALVRDVLLARKFNEFRKTVLRGRGWRSPSSGGFARKRAQGLVDPSLREVAMADAKRKVDEVNENARVLPEEPMFGVLREKIAMVRARSRTDSACDAGVGDIPASVARGCRAEFPRFVVQAGEEGECPPCGLPGSLHGGLHVA